MGPISYANSKRIECQYIENNKQVAKIIIQYKHVVTLINELRVTNPSDIHT
jgi:hypothetical protein